MSFPGERVEGAVLATPRGRMEFAIRPIEHKSERYFENAGDFAFVGRKPEPLFEKSDDRQDNETCTGFIRIEKAGSGNPFRGDACFLLRLAQGRVDKRRISFVHPAAGKAYLSGMSGKMRRSSREQDGGLRAPHDRNEYRSRRELRRIGPHQMWSEIVVAAPRNQWKRRWLGEESRAQRFDTAPGNELHDLHPRTLPCLHRQSCGFTALCCRRALAG